MTSREQIRSALRIGREIEVLESGQDRVLVAFGHPCKAGPATQPGSVLGPDLIRDPKKVCCYWYQGDERREKVVNMENLQPLAFRKG